MDNQARIRLLWLTVALVWLAAGVWTAGTVVRLREAKARLQAKTRDWQELKAMEKDMERYRAARHAFEGMTVKHPGPLDPALKKIGLECKIKEIANPPRCVPGWVIRQKDIDFSENEVPLSRVMQWVREIESQDTKGPPWRLARCSIRSSSRAPGSGQVVLLFEALEQNDAPPALVTPP